MQRDPLVDTLLRDISQLGDAYQNGEQGARERLMSSCQSLFSNLILPAESMLMTQWAHPTHNAVIRLGLDIHLFEALQGEVGAGDEDVAPQSQSTSAIAARTSPKTDPALVGRMLRQLASMGTVRETGPDAFAPTPFARALTRENFRDMVLFIQDDYQPCLSQWPDFFRQNQYALPASSLETPFTYTNGCFGQMNYFEYFGRCAPRMGKRFAGMMDVWSRDRPKWFQDGYYPVFLVDVGGGSGHDLQQLLERFHEEIPGRLILQDRPEIVQIADTGAEIEKMGHDFLNEQPVKGARAYYLHSIIQDWDDDTNIRILRSLLPAMRRGYSKILINDYIIPNEGAHWLQTSLDCNLMSTLGARHRTEAEMRKMIDGAGLAVKGIFRHPLSLDCVVEIEIE
ncbi:Demethylsterigmatocystin 6-O-methyltransferase [Apiospora aurea]|uniref:Demethylsterigmatocystin 6-O-methyltransferase n=1 Tax=Apiospora aurea TaxID=335848 RepID=A0ABR1Q121_9PEZI